TAVRKDSELATFGGQPVWSHDGKAIAYASPRRGVFWVVSPSGSGKRKVASMAHLNAITWSPNDKRLAFDAGETPETATSWVVSASGGKPVRLGRGTFPAGPRAARSSRST